MRLSRSVLFLAVLGACGSGSDGEQPETPEDVAQVSDSGGGVDAALDGGGDGVGLGDAGGDVGDAMDDAAGDAGHSDGGAGDGDAAGADAEDAGPPPPKGATEWLAYDDGTASGALQYQKAPEQVHEYVRFEMEQPVRIWGLRAQLRVPAAGEATVVLWDDFGGNFFNFDVEAPLAAVTREVTPADEGTWVEFPLAWPVDLVPGRMFYAGVVVNEGGAQLSVDAASETPEGKQPHSLVWFAAEPPDSGGFPAIAASPGDFLLQAEVELLDPMKPEDKDFEPVSLEDLGLPGFSRIALADVDGDGDLDVMLDGPRLFLNDGGKYTDVTEAWLPGITGHNGGVFGDYDNDGDPDYFATGFQNPQDRLLRNDGGGFTDVTTESGIDDTMKFNCNGDDKDQPVPTEAAAWLDVDNDGWLDLYQANFICWDPPAQGALDLLWRNNGDGTFTDITQPSGAWKGQIGGLAGRGVAPADADGDGLVDILVTNYRLHKDFFFQNKGGGKVEMTGDANKLTGVGTFAMGAIYFGHSIGAAWGDVDGDLDLDVFVAALAHPRFITFSQQATLYENPGGAGAVFQDVTELIGIRYLETPSNPNLWDWDNDGDLDLFYTCIYPDRTSQMYRNDGHPLWTEVTWQSGLAVYDGWGSVVGDIDGDGDLDLVASRGAFRNRNKAGAEAVVVRLEGSGAGKTNRDGVGARVIATVGESKVLRERFGAHGTGVQDSPWLHVGLGGEATADLEAHFPASGTVVTAKGVAAGRVVIREDGTVETLGE